MNGSEIMELRFGLCGILLALDAVMDLRKRSVILLPNLAAVCIGVILMVSGEGTFSAEWLLGIGLGIAVFFLAWISDEAIGKGDGAALTGTGALLGGWNNLFLLTGSLILAGIAGILLMVFCKKTRKAEMPFLCFAFPAYLVLLLTGGFI